MPTRIWPFMPQHGVDETLEWRTDVLRARAGEQRVALRDAPRQTFSYNHYMNEHQASLARALAYGQGAGDFWIPVWPEVSFVGVVAGVSTNIPVDTTVADYRAGSSLLLWESESKYTRATIASLTSSSVTLDGPTGIDFTAAYVCPLRYGKCTSGFSIKRGPNTLSEVTAEFRVDDNIDLGASAAFPTLDGIDVLTDTNYYLGDPQENIIQEVEIFDNATGRISTSVVYDAVDQTFTLSLVLPDKVNRMRIRKWLHLRKGKLKPFWLISQSKDLTLTTNALSTDTHIHVNSINYEAYYTTNAVAICRKNGTNTYHLVTYGTTSGGVDTLNLSAAVGVAADITDVDRISFMRRVCFDADRVELRHEDNGYTTIKVPVREVAN